MKVTTSAAQAKMVFLTGAGASMPLGSPDTGRFLQHLLHSTKLRSLGGKDAIARQMVQGLRDEIAGTKDVDIERILGRLDRLRDGLEAALTDPAFWRPLGQDASEHLEQYRTHLDDLRDVFYD